MSGIAVITSAAIAATTAALIRKDIIVRTFLLLFLADAAEDLLDRADRVRHGRTDRV